MRILSFTEMWPKLLQSEFTTFRFPRRDRDWQIGEVVQIVYKSRSKEREVLGFAEIISKESRGAPYFSTAEAIRDGFHDRLTMWEWLCKQYAVCRLLTEPINKLTLSWNGMTINFGRNGRMR